jgi:hypothetical protein
VVHVSRKREYEVGESKIVRICSVQERVKRVRSLNVAACLANVHGRLSQTELRGAFSFLKVGRVRPKRGCLP